MRALITGGARFLEAVERTARGALPAHAPPGSPHEDNYAPRRGAFPPREAAG
jgi:hypothetical protein